MKISVIVPVYNVEKYLNECIKSIICQTYKKLEIILVNDESTDSSQQICEFYEKSDSRIKLINKKNGGLSSARNEGIKIATGDYISFIDSDDFLVDNNVYQEMIKLIETYQVDIVHGDAIKYYSDEKQELFNSLELKNEFKKNKMRSEEFLIACMESKIIYAPVCFNLYKRKLLIDNSLLFREGIYHEDEEFTPKVILLANNIYVYKKAFYVYRQREGSIMNMGKVSKKAKDKFEVVKILDNIVDNINNLKLKKLMSNYISMMILNVIYEYPEIIIPREINMLLIKHSKKMNSKLRKFIYLKNRELYIRIEDIYRNIRGLKV